MSPAAEELDPHVDRGILLLATRALVVAAVLIAVGLGRPMHSALFPALVPLGGPIGGGLLVAAIGLGVAVRGVAPIAWAGGFAAVALLIQPLWSNTAFVDPIDPTRPAVKGVAEVLVRGGALAALGLWIHLERRWGVFSGR